MKAKVSFILLISFIVCVGLVNAKPVKILNMCTNTGISQDLRTFVDCNNKYSNLDEKGTKNCVASTNYMMNENYALYSKYQNWKNTGSARHDICRLLYVWKELKEKFTNMSDYKEFVTTGNSYENQVKSSYLNDSNAAIEMIVPTDMTGILNSITSIYTTMKRNLNSCQINPYRSEKYNRKCGKHGLNLNVGLNQ